MKRLEEIVELLESGDLAIEKSMQVFEEGMKLVEFCSKKLEEVEQKVTLLVKQNNGKYSQRPFEFKEKEKSENGLKDLS